MGDKGSRTIKFGLSDVERRLVGAFEGEIALEAVDDSTVNILRACACDIRAALLGQSVASVSARILMSTIARLTE